MKKTVLLTLTIIAITFASCHKPRVFSGSTITQDRQIDTNYVAVTASGSFDVYFVEDQDYDIRVICGENKMQYIKTYVDNGTLFITEKSNHVVGGSQNKVYINKSYLLSYRNEGSGNMHGSFSAAPYLDIENSGSGNMDIHCNVEEHAYVFIDGSGNITINGNSDSFIARINGSGNIDAFALYTKDAETDIHGSGSIYVNASESLQVNISGSGDVVYLGNPSISSSITGSGQVRPF